MTYLSKQKSKSKTRKQQNKQTNTQEKRRRVTEQTDKHTGEKAHEWDQYLIEKTSDFTKGVFGWGFKKGVLWFHDWCGLWQNFGASMKKPGVGGEDFYLFLISDRGIYSLHFALG